MTELLFQTDSYLRSFEAEVVEVDGPEVVLNRTAFYVTGGGQPHDTGKLETGSGDVCQVVDVRKRQGRVWHRLEGPPLQQGDWVHGEIDWPRRYQLMKTHTTLHVLSAVIFKDFEAPVTGGNMEPLKGRLDFELQEIPADFAAHVEKRIQEEIDAARDVKIEILPREEAMTIPDLIRTKVNLLPADIQEIRTVHIVGVDLQADGGTHVANTREIGRVRVLGCKSKGKNFRRIRIEIEETD